MSALTFEHACELVELFPAYTRLRREYPAVPARRVVEYLLRGEGKPFEQFTCPGHRWIYTGVAYGGEDESYHGEGRCYCANCGADGDA